MTTSIIMLFSKIFLLLFIRFLFSPTTQAEQVYLGHNCSQDKTFTANSSFQSNLTTLLSSFASANAFFHNATVVGRSDTVYGLFMCRACVTVQACHDCVVLATKALTSECKVSKEAIVWYGQCMVRYSNRSFFSTFETWPNLGLLNTGEVTLESSFQLHAPRPLLLFLSIMNLPICPYCHFP